MPIAAYLSVGPRDQRFLGFGFALAFTSSFGQTYFIGIFGPSVQASFDLSNTAWGTIYMAGTLASALLFTWTGKLIDRVDLRAYTAGVGIALIAACALMAAVAGPVSLALAIFLLRQAGQGLAGHIAITSMARYFEAARGRAIALATLGFAAGEAVLPFLAVNSIAVVGWRWTYAGIAAFLAVTLLPTLAWLLVGHSERHREHLDLAGAGLADNEAREPGWTRGKVLRDPRFLLLLPGVMAPAFILTAMFFHHLALADAKNWSHGWITGSYGIYAAAVIAASLISGRLVDRLGAARLVPFVLWPLVAGMALVAGFSNPWSAWPYLFLLGVNTGMAMTANSAMWAELYGTLNLGAIRSMTTALNVFASALGPVSMGALMDAGVSIEAVCLLFAGYAAFGSVLITLALRVRRPAPASLRS